MFEGDSNWNQKSQQLVKEMNEWKKTYIHRNPCKRFTETRFCEHLVQARNRKFKARIVEQLNVLIHGTRQFY